MLDKVLKGIGSSVLVVLVVLLLGLLAVAFAYPTKWLVNYLISPSALMAVFGIPALTFWKAMALNYVCGTLFKGTCSCPSK